MPRPTRYEPVPQTDQSDEMISLSSLDQVTPPSYNYNTGIPNSPPPSFRSAPPSVDGFANNDLDLRDLVDRSGNATPRGPLSIAPSIANTATTEALIVNLHKRMEKLEETIGKLILEKEERKSNDPAEGSQGRGNNCCVTFSGDIESYSSSSQAFIHRGDNCCVRFGPSSRSSKAADRRTMLMSVVGLVMSFVLVVSLFLVVDVSAEARKSAALGISVTGLVVGMAVMAIIFKKGAEGTL